MSQDIWPTFIGESFPTREPIHDTIVQLSSSGQDEVRIAKYPYPRYKYTFQYQYLGDGFGPNYDYGVFIAFFKDHAGRFDSFLLYDPDDNKVTNEQIGVGDGSTKNFQLMRTRDNYQEPVYGFKSVTVKSPGIGNTITPYGLIQFNSAPGAGTPIIVDAQYYWRVRFDTDNLQFQKIGMGIWALKQVDLVTTRQ